ncbi:MAG: alanine--tRNA ligase [Planctomycetota bacterium]
MTGKPRIGAHEIRERFLRYFEDRGHTRVASSPLVPQNDPTLLFTNAGMVQFKDVFLGRDERAYARATSSQRCLRAGGKHNDLDNVGFTPRHHTLFEMLGNFSFGDYFKKDAIEFAWTFLTDELGIPAERLVVSVFDGTGEAAPWDEEAYGFWQELGVPRERIYKCNAKENFWQMGDTGPCGPCTEIHYCWEGAAPPDALTPGKGPAHEDTRYMELWNLVFMQYDKQPDGTLVPLPRPCVDTGAGLERLACVVEGVKSNYETSLLSPLVSKARALAGVSGHQGEQESAYQVIADHARATSFLIADNVFPDNNGRNYVLRRIMRRAIRFGEQVGIHELFFHEVCLEVVNQFGAAYPELRKASKVIEEVVRTEEAAFRRTLREGLKRFGRALAELPEGAKTFPVEAAGKLKDTYGFPVDLTGVMAREQGLSLDEGAVERWIEEVQGGGEAGFKGGGEKIKDAYYEVTRELPEVGRFLGWDVTSAKGCVLQAILRGDLSVTEANAGDEVELVFDATPFYAESGGQLGDTGRLASKDCEAVITDCHKPTGGPHFHRAKVLEGTLHAGRGYRLEVDVARRDAIRRNHSATHLLHHALRSILGEHVIQKGSLVAPDRLRFDFSHGKPLSPQERQRIERMINEEVVANAESRTREMAIEEAQAMGAMSLFGEKYSERVRVVEIGGSSIELCGGTHVSRAGDIGLFAITAEAGIAQGVRRIEAVTGLGALDHYQRQAETLGRAQEALKAGDGDELLGRIEKLQAQLKGKTKEVEELKGQLAAGGASGGAVDEVQDVGGVKLLAKRVPTAEPKVLREAADALRHRIGSGVVVLAGEDGGTARLLVAVTSDLTKRVHAGKLVGALASHVDGKGGGRPDLAQAGGPKVDGLDAVVAGARDGLAAQLGV